MARKSVVKLRRGPLRVLQSTDFWIVLVSPAGNSGRRWVGPAGRIRRVYLRSPAIRLWSFN